MQVVDILSNDMDVKIFFQFCQPDMRGIGFCLRYIFATQIIKVQNQLRIFSPGSWGGHIFDIITLPQTITVTKCLQTTFRTNACTGQYHELLFHTVKLIMHFVLEFLQRSIFYKRTSKENQEKTKAR